MFPISYFPANYFPNRFWPPVGAASEVGGPTSTDKDFEFLVNLELNSNIRALINSKFPNNF